ncbi:BspA family leucine-rich repeat surface protein [Bifidobacterium sp. ESL0775]|uniref:BspA family leucine-rich repeat surface protein n=1 Tax=Bifidobacterium sp. ESL0775 TaxID=2983230 RepID=UPI0023F70AAC|nr:BspA family leucine-rich repeat surface protein [Bifidobacterium sp. ESL0775]WEV69310.1 BspA family leucine-rich repeat surface protein [Bifidobacterium sp. ESL0775]
MRGEPAVGPQSSCSTRHGTWNTATWDFDADCVLAIHGGDTGSTPSTTPFGSGSTAGTIANTAASVTIDGSVIISTGNAFAGWTSLQLFTMGNGASLTLSGQGAYRLFASDTALATVDTTGWDTSQATTMYSMFYQCRTLFNLNLSGFDTARAATMQYMLGGCAQLTSLDLSGWNLTGLNATTNMDNIFDGDTGLTTIDAHGWHVNNTVATALADSTSGTSKFADATNLKTLNVSDWILTGATKTTYLFAHCAHLTDINVSGWTGMSNVAAMNGTFASNTKLTAITGLPDWDSSHVTDMREMFANDRNLMELDLSGWDVSHIDINGMSKIFFLNTSLPVINTSRWRIGNTSVALDIAFKQGPSTIIVNDWDLSATTSLSGLFKDCTNLTGIIGMGTWDTSTITNMSNMFYKCGKLASADVSHFDTSHVSTIDYMFYNCSSLVVLDVTGWRTPQLTSMIGAFHGCAKLTVFDPSRFDTSHITGFNSLFTDDAGLKLLDLRGWDTSAGTGAWGVFDGMLPSGLRMLALGPNTRLKDSAYGKPFDSVNQNINWMQMQSFDAGAAPTGWTGRTPALDAKANTNPAGFYVDSTYVGATLVVDANGGAGSYYTDTDTTTAGAAIDAPAATVLNGHRPHAVFDGWNTKRDGTGHAYQPGQRIASLARGEYFPHQTIILYAQWRAVNAPGSLTTTYHHTGDKVRVAGTVGHAGTVQACLAPGQCQTTQTTGGAWTIDLAAATFTAAYPMGAQYTLTTSITDSVADAVTGQPVTSPETKLTGTLPWTSVTLTKDGADTPVGTVPTVAPVYTDTSDNKAYASLPRLAASGGISVAGGYLTGWNHQASQPTPEYATPGATTIPTTDGTTDGNGHTTVTLHPVWNILNAPTGTGQRSPTGNGVRFTATGKPWTNTDTITLCVKPHTQPAYTDCTTPTTTSGWTNGDYTINKDYTRTQMPQGGQYDIKTTLTTPGTTDTWRGDGTTPTGPLTKTNETTVRISNTYQGSLPLTGGRPQRLAALLAAGLALALLLLAAADWLRHQRQANARHSK